LKGQPGSNDALSAHGQEKRHIAGEDASKLWLGQ